MNDQQDGALLALLEALTRRGYRFINPTPATHQRVLANRDARGRDLRDVFGWSMPFARDRIDDEIWRLLEDGGLVEPVGGNLFRATIRVSTLGVNLFVHSAFPTVQEDAVFFGPDTYRFARLIEAELRDADRAGIGAAVDIGTGAGVGAIVLKRLCPSARTFGTDVNARALRFAAVNAAFAGVAIETVEADSSEPLGIPIDLAVANPPYIVDTKSRAYRDGGELHGAQVAIDMVADTLPQLSPAGSMILYTGSPIVGGEDQLRLHLEQLAAQHRRHLRYWMLDPDVFGEELEKEPYRDVERIELVAAVFAPLDS